MASDIIYIDDEPQHLLASAKTHRAGKRFADYMPPDLKEAGPDAATANLWVFDFYNDDKERERPSLEVSSSNGLSVFQQFRLLVGDARPPAMVVSNHLESALGSEINLARRHILAEEFGVEWVAPKTLKGGEVITEILALADAAEALRESSAPLKDAGPTEYVPELCRVALHLPRNVDWQRAVIREVAGWRPPIWLEPGGDHRVQALRDELAVNPDIRSVRAVIAWMLRQVLPYPSFLIRDRHVAVRLGVSLNCLRTADNSATGLSRRLKRLQYRGILSEFDGTRWWGAGVDALEWSLPRQKEERSDALRQLFAPVPLVELEFADPVVVSDADLVETDEIAPAAECVRATDEHFPSQAAPGWVKIADARVDKALARKVRQEDQRELVAEG
ncbi:hypothetical protein NKI74_21410 [Mesorhizobium sp. M0494]|uniref:hypothetical protein n=1 Tax=Mesorhizobium sp. M0494 TaxID=2956951 RepID=UPI00333C09AE